MLKIELPDGGLEDLTPVNLQNWLNTNTDNGDEEMGDKSRANIAGT